MAIAVTPYWVETGEQAGETLTFASHEEADSAVAEAVAGFELMCALQGEVAPELRFERQEVA